MNKSDPDRYRELSKPFPSIEAAEEALRAFQEELEALREKHRIRDLVFIMSFGFLNVATGEESDAILNGNFGDLYKVESLLAYALGAEQVSRQARVGELLKGLKTGQRKP